MTGPHARPRHRSRLPLAWLLPLVLVACGGPPTPSPSASGTAPAASPSRRCQPGPHRPGRRRPGSDSTVYQPNPGALVVAIDAGHGGCLDWGVPDPRQRGVRYSEKTMTLAIAQQLQSMLEAQGVTVVMTRDDDVALAGDDYPDLGCHGPPWRDVNGDGESGFDPEGAVRTRDELQARLDLANLVRADVLVSIHINSLTENGVVFDIAATETFYTDETPWGVDVTAPLAQAIQDGVVTEMDGVADYDRQDRGIQAHNLFIVAPPLLEDDARPARSPQAADAWRPDAVGAHRGRFDHAPGGAGPARIRDRPARRRAGHLRRPAGPVCGPRPRRGVPGSEPGADARHPAGRRSRRRPDVLGAAGSRRPAANHGSPTPAPNRGRPA